MERAKGVDVAKGCKGAGGRHFEQAPPRGRGRGDHCGRGRVVPELKAMERAKGVGIAKGCKSAGGGGGSAADAEQQRAAATQEAVRAKERGNSIQEESDGVREEEIGVTLLTNSHSHYQEPSRYSDEKMMASASRSMDYAGGYNETAKPIKVEPIAWSLLAMDAPGVTTEQSNDVQRVVQSLMDRPWADWCPKVCISYATGTREGTDARGAGPGMLQAAVITHALYNAGIACASGLCVPVGHDWKGFLPKIDSRFSRCEVLIVLLSPAFYRSKPCLLEIHKSTKAKSMVIIPLRCTEPLPSKDGQWLDIDQKDLLVLDQVQDKLGPINALPPRGCFFDSPSYLDDLVGRVRGVIDATAEASAEVEAAEERDSVQKFLATATALGVQCGGPIDNETKTPRRSSRLEAEVEEITAALAPRGRCEGARQAAS
eukprot:scaffold76690_cov63-Phaeocystis_antarctica.AAC.2